LHLKENFLTIVNIQKKFEIPQSSEEKILGWQRRRQILVNPSGDIFCTLAGKVCKFECKRIRKEWPCRRACQNVLKMSTFSEKCPSTKISYFGKNNSKFTSDFAKCQVIAEL